MLKFWETVFRRRLPSSLRKNTHGKFAEKFGEKIRRKIFVFRCVFRSVFLLFSGHPILRAFFNLQIEKIRAESVLQEISFNLSQFKGASRKLCKRDRGTSPVGKKGCEGGRKREQHQLASAMSLAACNQNGTRSNILREPDPSQVTSVLVFWKWCCIVASQFSAACNVQGMAQKNR